MMKTQKIAVFLLAIVCLTGCSLANPSTTPSHMPEQEILDRVVTFLDQKYNMEFDIYSNTRWGNEQGRSMLAYVVGTNPQLNFDVEVGFEGSDSLTIHDGYVGMSMKPLIRQRYLDVIAPYYPVAEVQATNPGMHAVFPDTMGTDTTFDEFLDYVCQNPGSIFASVYFSVPDGETEDESVEKIDAIVDDIKTAFPPQCVTSAAFAGYSPEAYETSVVDDPEGARDTNNKGYAWSNVSFDYDWDASQPELRKVR